MRTLVEIAYTPTFIVYTYIKHIYYTAAGFMYMGHYQQYMYYILYVGTTYSYSNWTMKQSPCICNFT